MLYRGIRGAQPRTLRTVAEDRGTTPAGFAGAMVYSPETGTMVGPGMPAPQAYVDAAAPKGLSTARTNGVPDPKPFGR